MGLYKLNTGKEIEATQVFDKLILRQNKTTGGIEDAKSSITRSRGENLITETTALTMILLLNLKNNDRYL